MERIRTGDIVEVISGNHKGRQGKILRFNADRSRAYVEKVALIKKHGKPTPKNPAGGITEKENSINISNLMLVDPSNKNPGRIKIKTLADGKKIRVFKKSGTELKAVGKK